MDTTSDIERVQDAGIDFGLLPLDKARRRADGTPRPAQVMGLAALREIDRRTHLAVIDHYLSRPFQVRSVHREARRGVTPATDVASAGGPPVYDGTVLDELRQVLKPESIARALELFELQIDRVVGVCFEPTRETLALEVHGLSGSAGMLGFMELGEASRTLQHTLGAKVADGRRSGEALDALADALRRAIRVLVELRAADWARAAG